MHERFRIHHAVGSRVMLDSDRDSVRFAYRQEGGGCVFSVYTEYTPAIAEILRLKDEINVFIFKEVEGTAVEKIWFYTGEGSAAYNDNEKCLIIAAGSGIVYRPGDYQM